MSKDLTLVLYKGELYQEKYFPMILKEKGYGHKQIKQAQDIALKISGPMKNEWRVNIYYNSSSFGLNERGGIPIRDLNTGVEYHTKKEIYKMLGVSKYALDNHLNKLTKLKGGTCRFEYVDKAITSALVSDFRKVSNEPFDKDITAEEFYDLVRNLDLKKMKTIYLKNIEESEKLVKGSREQVFQERISKLPSRKRRLLTLHYKLLHNEITHKELGEYYRLAASFKFKYGEDLERTANAWVSAIENR